MTLSLLLCKISLIFNPQNALITKITTSSGIIARNVLDNAIDFYNFLRDKHLLIELLICSYETEKPLCTTTFALSGKKLMVGTYV